MKIRHLIRPNKRNKYLTITTYSLFDNNYLFSLSQIKHSRIKAGSVCDGGEAETNTDVDVSK